jgi:adenylosuccinate synthase
MSELGQVDVMLGMQMGDEGKGRFTYQFAGEGYLVVARYNGGANAGHTFEYLGKEINTHQIPSGITYDGVLNLLTNCSLFDPSAIREEMRDLSQKGIEISPSNLGVSESASLVLPHNIMWDEIREGGSGKQGSTVRGISSTAADKFGRTGVFFHQIETSPDEVEEKFIKGIEEANAHIRRNGGGMFSLRNRSRKLRKLIRNPKEEYERWFQDARAMLPYMVNTVEIIQETLRNGDRILAEGAQSIGLDIDHGIRQENTSSLTGVAGAQQSLGIAPNHIGTVYGVAKLFKSRVGGSDDSFPTKIHDEVLAERIRGEPGTSSYEAGKSTGRLRDMGWFDMTDIGVAKERNGISKLLLTKLDCIPLAGDAVKIATHYTDDEDNVHLERPNHTDFMKKHTPKYVELPTWEEDIRGITSFDDLPENAKNFVEKIEELAQTDVIIIGTGPDDAEKIDRRKTK